MKYADVLIDTKSSQIGGFFTYSIPERLTDTLAIGQLVLVPFRNKEVQAVVGRIHSTKPSFAVRSIYAILDLEPVVDPIHWQLAEFIADKYLAPLAASVMLMTPDFADFKTKTMVSLTEVARGFITRSAKQQAVLEFMREHDGDISKNELKESLNISDAPIKALADAGVLNMSSEIVWREASVVQPAIQDFHLTLSPDQEKAYNTIVKNPGGKYLLHGVTGSGKTEVYLQLVDHVIKQGKSAIVLVPEISITPQTVQRFADRYPGLVATLHSGLSKGERFDAWQMSRQGLKQIVIGPRSALFAPVKDLGLIVIDEEHDQSFKQDNMPRYHARTVAEKLAEMTGATLVLGSATPSLESYYRATQKELTLLEMPQPIFSIERPRTYIVDMREELKAGNKTIFSELLQVALKKVLARGKQSLLFINRRGSATIILCRDCGYVMACPNCNLPMVYHKTGGVEYAQCHHCLRTLPAPKVCPKCGKTNIKYLGIGTERVEEEAHKLLPEARLIRVDKDTTAAKDAYQKVYQALIGQEADIVIGTQMIAKGWDLPHLDLVGIVLADPGLYWPEFRTNERNFQMLAQVVGRTGRREHPGAVVLQTYTPENPILTWSLKQDYTTFYESEILFRKDLRYPPHAELIKLMYPHKDKDVSMKETEELSKRLREIHPDLLVDWGSSFFNKLRGEYRYQVIIRGKTMPPQLLEQLRNLPSPWVIDVDPISVL